MAAAQPTPAKLWEVRRRVELGLVHVAQSFAAVGVAAEALAFPELVKPAIVVPAHASVVAAPRVALEPAVARAPTTNPAMVAAQAQLAELGPMGLAFAFQIAMAVAPASESVPHMEGLARVELVSIAQNGVLSEDLDVHGRGAVLMAPHTLGEVDSGGFERCWLEYQLGRVRSEEKNPIASGLLPR